MQLRAAAVMALRTSPDLVSSGRYWSFPPTTRTTAVSVFKREVGALRSLACASSRVPTRVSQSRSGQPWHWASAGSFRRGAVGEGGVRLQLPRPLGGKGDHVAQDMGVGVFSPGMPRFIILLAVDGFLEQFVSATYMMQPQSTR